MTSHRFREEGQGGATISCLASVLTKRGINRIKQGYLYLTRIKICITDFLQDIQKCGNEKVGSQRN